jgi:hypothetical protein
VRTAVPNQPTLKHAKATQKILLRTEKLCLSSVISRAAAQESTNHLADGRFVAGPISVVLGGIIGSAVPQQFYFIPPSASAQTSSKLTWRLSCIQANWFLLLPMPAEG